MQFSVSALIGFLILEEYSYDWQHFLQNASDWRKQETTDNYNSVKVLWFTGEAEWTCSTY